MLQIVVFCFILIFHISNANDRIVGGKTAQQGQFPFQAQIISKATTFPINGAHCGGSLISPNWVLTAAHCFRDVDQGTEVNPQNYYISVDNYNLNLATDSEKNEDVVVRQIDSVTFHPTYVNGASVANRVDLALVKLTTATEGVLWIRVCNPSTNNVTELLKRNANVTAVGFGSTNPDRNNPSTPIYLQYVVIPVVSTGTCRGQANWVNANIHVCAGSSGKDTCVGDSGGPLFGTDRGNDVLVGVTEASTGNTCDGIYGVYTNVCNAHDWIVGVTGELPEPTSHAIYLSVNLLVLFITAFL